MAASKSITRNLKLYLNTAICEPNYYSQNIKGKGADNKQIQPNFTNSKNENIGYGLYNEHLGHGDSRLSTFAPNMSRSVQNNFYLIFGEGNTPATKEDIKLASDICPLEDLDYSGCDIWMDPDGQFLFKIQVTITNITEEIKIFKEMGLACKSRRGADWINLETEGYLLFAREVFEEPITLAPGDSRTFILTIDF